MTTPSIAIALAPRSALLEQSKQLRMLRDSTASLEKTGMKLNRDQATLRVR